MLRNGIPLPVRSESLQTTDNQIFSGIHGENGSASHNTRRATAIEEVTNRADCIYPLGNFRNRSARMPNLPLHLRATVLRSKRKGARYFTRSARSDREDRRLER